MIKETIKIHFEKEQPLFEQGVKAISLFFMESDTSLFRGENPKVKNIFEEEYKKQYNEVVIKLDQTSDYYKYLQNDLLLVEVDDDGGIASSKDKHQGHLLDAFRYYLFTFHNKKLKLL